MDTLSETSPKTLKTLKTLKISKTPKTQKTQKTQKTPKIPKIPKTPKTPKIMKLKDWFKYIVPFHEIIYNTSVDDVDVQAGAKWDHFIDECIGVSVQCTMNFINELSSSNSLNSLNSLNPLNNRDKLVLCAFSPNSERGRRVRNEVNRPRILHTLASNGIGNRPIGDAYWGELLRHKFVVSPEGNGIQCHRTYEALYWKAIPIVEDNPLSIKQLEGLPILFTHDYSEINEKYLNKKYEEMLEKEYDFSFLFMSNYSEETQERIRRRTQFWSKNFTRDKIEWKADISKISKCDKIFEEVAFITMTNNGYKEVTHNCIKSLESVFNGGSHLQICCLDNESKDYFDTHLETHLETKLEENKVKTKVKLFTNTFLPDSTKNISHGSHFQDPNWNTVTFQKFLVVSEYLKKNKFVLFTDGDIVFRNSYFLIHLYKTMLQDEKLDMIIQTEWGKPYDTKLCSGFFLLRQNEKTLKFFDEKTLRERNAGNHQNDQEYLNNYKNELNYQLLSPDYYPNGKYFYEHSLLDPFIVHFNYLKGIGSKMNKMKQYNMWYL